MALVNEPEISREDGEILVSVGQAVQGGRDADSIPKLRKRHPSGSSEDAADMKARVTKSEG